MPSFFHSFRFSLVGFFALLLGTSSSAHAVLIAYEGFNYSSGLALNGLNGGSGFSSGWVENAAANVDTTSPGLSFPNLTVSGNAASLVPTTGAGHSTRSLSSSIDSGTLYVSYLIDPTTLVQSTFTGMILFNSLDAQAVFFGKNSGVANWSMSGIGITGNLQSTTAVVEDTLNLLVLRVDFNASGVNERIRFYLNPVPGSLEPSTPAIDVIAGDFGTLAKIGFGTGNTSTATMDEFRLGTTWNEVVPLSAIPEPATAFLMLTGLGAIMLQQRLHPGKARI